jgi:hypothetical protein
MMIKIPSAPYHDSFFSLQSTTYCKFFEYYFTFHDIFVPFALILLSVYVSLKFSGKNRGGATRDQCYDFLNMSAEKSSRLTQVMYSYVLRQKKVS